MKSLTLILSGLLLTCALVFGQTPRSIKYQAVARDNAGQVIANTVVNVKLSIVSGQSNGTIESSETHLVSTNDFGLFNINIGKGTLVSGDYANIDWGSEDHFLMIEIDPEGGSNFILMGVSELVSVPYAMHAETVTNKDDADANPTNEIQDLNLSGSKLTITGNATPTVIDLAPFHGSDDQALSYDGANYLITLEDGGTIDISNLSEDGDPDPTNEVQSLSTNGNELTLSKGGGTISLDDADADPTNEIQTIALNGNVLTLSDGGGTIALPGDDSETNELQDLDMISNYLYITDNPDATVIDLNPLMDNTDDQLLGFDQNTGILALEDGGVVDLSVLIDDADADPSNELQTVSRIGEDIILSGNNSTVSVADADNNPQNEIQILVQNGSDVTLTNGGGSFSINDDDHSTINELQDLFMQGDSLTITNNPNASVIDFSPYIDDQDLSFSGTQLTIEDGNTVDLSSLIDDADASTSNELQDLFKIGDTLIISHLTTPTIVDMTEYKDNTDDQSLSLSGNDLSIEDGNTIDLSPFMDDTDTDDQTLNLVGNTLSIADGNSVDLSSFMDDTDTDDQTLSISNDSMFIADGNGVDLSPYLDDTDTDDQTLALVGNTLSIADGNSVDLSAYMDDTDTDDQTLSISNDSMFIADGNGVSLVPYLDNTDAQSLTLNETTDSLFLSGGNAIDLGKYSQNLTSEVVPNDEVTIKISDGWNTTISVADSDADSTNELQVLSISNDTLSLSDGGSVVLPSASGSAPEHLFVQPDGISGGYVTFGSAQSVNGISYDATTEEFTLKAGKTYMLDGAVYMHTTTSSDTYSFVFYDKTNNAKIGSEAYQRTADYSGAIINQPSMAAIITPVTDIQVGVKDIYGATGGFISTRGFFRIVELK